MADQPVAVVGGSAAGLLTTCLLAREGVAVRVFEQSETLTPAERTLIVTHRLKQLLGPLAADCIVNEIRQFELFTDGRAATVRLNRPDLVIERSKLIRGLAESAQQAGAKIYFGRKFRGIVSRQDGLVLELKQTTGKGREEILSDTVVGGDGAASQVAQATGWPRQVTAPLIQALVALPKDMSPDTVRVWFVPQDTPYFYWLIPDSPERGALGMIGETGAEAQKHLEIFLEKRKLDPLGFQAARIPIYTGWVPVERRFGRGRVYLVGDAAGQVKVTTVGGIVTGLRGAAGVARAILNGRGREGREICQLRRELDLHLLVRNAIHGFTQKDYSRLVDLLNAPARRSLSLYSRDEALKVLWRICLNQPRFLLMGLRGLLKRGRPLAHTRM